MKVIPKGGYGRVDKAVTGMNESAGLHHVRVWGLVDKDMRSGQDISNTLGKNIWVLTVWEIESLYYTTDAIRAVAGHQMKNKKITSHIGNLYRVLSNAYDVLKQEQDAKIVARDISRRKMRKESENKIGSMDANRKASLESKAPPKIIIEIEDSYFNDLDSFKADVNSAASGRNNEKAWNTLLKQYPIHKTSAFGTIANVLKLDKKGYENTLLFSSARKRSAGTQAQRIYQLSFWIIMSGRWIKIQISGVFFGEILEIKTKMSRLGTKNREFAI